MRLLSQPNKLNTPKKRKGCRYSFSQNANTSTSSIGYDYDWLYHSFCNLKNMLKQVET